eukprot:UN4839
MDVTQVRWVINFDVPSDADSYVHRCARACRYGRPGCVVSFMRDDDDSEDSVMLEPTRKSSAYPSTSCQRTSPRSCRSHAPSRLRTGGPLHHGACRVVALGRPMHFRGSGPERGTIILASHLLGCPPACSCAPRRAHG